MYAEYYMLQLHAEKIECATVKNVSNSFFVKTQKRTKVDENV